MRKWLISGRERSYKLIKCSNTGRTMIEMLGVLAIMGILAVTAIKSYHSFVTKAKVQATTKMIKTLALERQNSAIDLSTGGRRERTGPHSKIYVKNGTEGKYREYFWIDTTIEDEDFCEGVKKSDMIGAEVIEGSCPGEIIFYFKKDPFNGMAGTYQNEGGAHFCPPHAASCEDENTPTSCDDGYYLDGGECLACPSLVATCADENTPLACIKGYYLDEGECFACPEHSICTTNGFSCKDNYYGDNCENAPLVCENGGAWDTTNHKCDCPDGYEGERCQTYNACYNVNCGSHGNCLEGTCTCTDNYYGSHCETAPLTCQNSGTWNIETHACDCVDGYTGATCSDISCNDASDCQDCEICNANGVCEATCTDSQVCRASFEAPSGEKMCCLPEKLVNNLCCAFPDGNGGCNECAEDSDCTEEGKLYCNTETGKCQKCPSDISGLSEEQKAECNICPTGTSTSGLGGYASTLPNGNLCYCEQINYTYDSTNGCQPKSGTTCSTFTDCNKGYFCNFSGPCATTGTCKAISNISSVRGDLTVSGKQYTAVCSAAGSNVLGSFYKAEDWCLAQGGRLPTFTETCNRIEHSFGSCQTDSDATTLRAQIRSLCKAGGGSDWMWVDYPDNNRTSCYMFSFRLDATGDSYGTYENGNKSDRRALCLLPK